MITPSKRSTLKLDLKDLSPKASTPYVGHFGVAAVSAVALVSSIISINSPSASPSVLDGALKISSIDLLPGPRGDQSETAVDALTDRASIEVVADSTSSPEKSKATQVAILAEPGRNEMKWAMLAPSLSIEGPRPAKIRLQRPTVKKVIPAAAIEEDDIAVIGSVPVIKATPDLEIEKPPARNEIVVAMIGSPVARAIQQPAAENPSAAHMIGENSKSSYAALKYFEPRVSFADANALNPVSAQPELEWLTEKVKKKDTLSQIFNRLGLSSKEAYLLVKNEQAKPLTRIRPGQIIAVTRNPSEQKGTPHQLQYLRYKLSKFDTLVVSRTGKGFEFETETKRPEIRYRSVNATIWSSLLGSAKEEKIPYDIVYSLASIFGWQVDFAKDIQDGDQYSVIYEELYLDGEVVGSGQIVAAELTTGNGRLRAVRHVDEDNRATYYAPDGDGIQGSFLRTPVKFARVTSKFSNKRFHPIKKKWKAHKGVDYGAPMKTPILATGNGVVKFAGNKKGYGRTIILRHGDQYETLYAHLNHFKKGLRSGSRVNQGEVIGYVGKSGWTTGPHLHYEFRINGQHKNPLTVELPKSSPIEKKYRDQFQQSAQRWVAALDDAGKIPLALKD